LFNGKLFCTGQHVRGRLQWLKQAGFSPLTLGEAVDAIKNGASDVKLPIVITVDDGWYSSKADIIEPALASGFPVTLYVATEVLQNASPVIDVAVNYIIWRAHRTSIVIRGLGSPVDGPYDLSDSAARNALASRAIEWISTVKAIPGAAGKAMESFSQALGLSSEELALHSRRFHYMTAAELHAVAQQGCAVELHGHGHFYPMGRPDLLRADIEQCRNILVSLGFATPRHYCFPSGEHDGHAAAVLQALQIDSGTTCSPALVRTGGRVSTAYLPRYLDGGNVSMLEFQAMVSGFDHVLRHLISTARVR
jgi:peptidoglycan/xylan/chitin deacetylase (PgdA/CDA1 family)